MLTFRTVMAGPVPAIRSVDLPRLMAGTVAGHDDERRVTTFGFWYNPVPAFKDETAERWFWESRDSADYLDWSRAERVRMPNLKPSTTAISLRLPVPLLERIKVAANKRDVPYQSLIKMWLAEKVEGA